jgi:hypothetical protein
LWNIVVQLEVLAGCPLPVDLARDRIQRISEPPISSMMCLV